MTEDLRRGTKLGDYQLLLCIGYGGMATVWVAKQHAKNPDDERLVAVKAILKELSTDPEFVRMFLDEGRLVKSIRHPNVVEVYEVNSQDGIVFMSMEWVEGDSLHTLIAEAGKRRPIPPEMAVRIVADVAHGLGAAHELQSPDGRSLGVVHRDVSPHNILIGTDGAVRLVDFGLAKAMGRMSEVTVAGQVKGKFGYMSPEQATAKAVDQRSDIFSLGIVLFELTTGRRLFRGENDADTLRQVVSGPIPRPTAIDPSYPRELETIVGKALQRDVDKRYRTAAELARDLEAYLKTRRIVVARGGIAGLLKRVLGEPIEQRREALRSALESLAGPGPGSNLISADPAFAGVSTGSSIPPRPSGSFSTGAAAPSSSTPSGSGSARAVPGSNSQASAAGAVPLFREPRRGKLGYAMIGLALVAIAVVVLFTLERKTTTTTLTIPAATPAAASPRSPKAADPDEGLPTVDLDKLELLDGAVARHAAPRKSAPRNAAPSKGAGNKPAEPAEPPELAEPAEPAEPATNAAPPAAELPRENPY